MDRKRNLFRLMETYMNDFRGDAIQEMYGKDAEMIDINNLTQLSLSLNKLFVRNV